MPGSFNLDQWLALSRADRDTVLRSLNRMIERHNEAYET